MGKRIQSADQRADQPGLDPFLVHAAARGTNPRTLADRDAEIDQLRAALAESERKRVEAERFLKLRTRQDARGSELWARAAEEALAGDMRALRNRVAMWRDPARLTLTIVQSEDATPTQETPHVES